MTGPGGEPQAMLARGGLGGEGGIGHTIPPSRLPRGSGVKNIIRVADSHLVFTSLKQQQKLLRGSRPGRVPAGRRRPFNAASYSSVGIVGQAKIPFPSAARKRQANHFPRSGFQPTNHHRPTPHTFPNTAFSKPPPTPAAFPLLSLSRSHPDHCRRSSPAAH